MQTPEVRAADDGSLAQSHRILVMWSRPPSGAVWVISRSPRKAAKKPPRLKFPALGFAPSPERVCDLSTVTHCSSTAHLGATVITSVCPRNPAFQQPSPKEGDELPGTRGTSQTSALCSSHKDQWKSGSLYSKILHFLTTLTLEMGNAKIQDFAAFLEHWLKTRQSEVLSKSLHCVGETHTCPQPCRMLQRVRLFISLCCVLQIFVNSRPGVFLCVCSHLFT